MPAQECLAFEFEHANGCWQADTTMGLTIVWEGKHRQTYLIAFIDDANRLLVHGEFFFEDKAVKYAEGFPESSTEVRVHKHSSLLRWKLPMDAVVGAFIG